MLNQRNTLILAALFLALTLGYLFSTWGKGSLGTDSFAVQDTTGIQRITLTRQFAKLEKQEVITLERQEKGWMVNKLYEPHPAQVASLLKAIAHLQAREKVAETARKNALASIKGANVRVDIEHEQGTRTYYIGPPAPDKKGSLALLEGVDDPYIVEIPGFVGSVHPHFATQVKHWRQLPLLKGTQKTLKKVELQYTGGDSSFVLIKQDNGIWKMPGLSTDTAKTMAYMNQYRDIYAVEPAEESYPGKFEQLKETAPQARLTITNNKGKRTTLVIYYVTNYPDLYLGYVKGQDELMLIQHFVLSRFLRTKGDFVTPGTS